MNVLRGAEKQSLFFYCLYFFFVLKWGKWTRGEIFVYFGTAKDIITPPFNMILACARGNTDNYEYVHDDVFVRCLAMSDGENKTVLMSFDFLFHERSLNNELASYAKEKYGVEPSAFIVGATHDHIGPSARGYSQCFANEEYEEFLLDRAKKCLDRADTV